MRLRAHARASIVPNPTEHDNQRGKGLRRRNKRVIAAVVEPAAYRSNGASLSPEAWPSIDAPHLKAPCGARTPPVSVSTQMHTTTLRAKGHTDAQGTDRNSIHTSSEPFAAICTAVHIFCNSLCAFCMDQISMRLLGMAWSGQAQPITLEQACLKWRLNTVQSVPAMPQVAFP